MTFPSKLHPLLNLFFAHLFVLPQATPTHICEHIMKGNFAAIKLNSITWDGSTLLLYEGGTSMYRIDQGRIYLNELNLKESLREEALETYQPVFKKMNPAGITSFSAIYHFKQKQRRALSKAGFFVRIGAQETMLDDYTWDDIKVMWKGSEHVDEYSILHDGDSGTMYAVNRDTYSGTNNFVIYQISVNFDTLALERLHKAHPNDKSSAKYYFLQKSIHPYETILVHRQASAVAQDPQYQMFSSIPYGFLHANNLHLFDTKLGCVYVLQGWDSKNLDKEFVRSKENLKFHRLSFPYENYFKCSTVEYPKSPNFPHDGKRCLSVAPPTTTTTTDKPDPWATVTLGNTTKNSNATMTTTHHGWFSGNIFFAALAGIVLILGVCCCICCIEYIRGKMGRRKKFSLTSMTRSVISVRNFHPLETFTRSKSDMRSKLVSTSSSASKTRSISKTPNLMLKTGTSSSSTSRSPLAARGGSKSRPVTPKQNSMHRKLKTARARSPLKTAPIKGYKH